MIQTNEVAQLSRDLRKAVVTLSDQEARFLVYTYYQMQDNRIRSANQLRSMNSPHLLIEWLTNQNLLLEKQVASSLKKYAESKDVGKWLLNICGIGSIITAGLLAHIDIHKAPTAGHIWSFAGLNPTKIWNKGQKRPFNVALKTLCWKIGESFVKVSNNPKDIYGRVYKLRKESEIRKNDNGDFKEQAENIFKTKRIGKTTDAYKAYANGKLPPAHIHARAKRYAIKLFLSHLHGFWYEHEFNKPAPLPYPIAHLDHEHFITLETLQASKIAE